jgi:general secretion pathway protein L
MTHSRAAAVDVNLVRTFRAGAALAGAGSVRLWRWWLSELQALSPRWLADLAVPQMRQTVLIASDSGFALEYRSRHEARRIGEFADLDMLAAKLGDITRTDGSRQRDGVLVELSPSDALLRMIDVPTAAAAQLRKLLTHEVERRTPFLLADVYFEYAVVGRNPSERRLRVALIVVARGVVAKWREALRQRAIELAGVLVPVPSAPAIPLDLDDQHQVAKGRGHWLARVNLALAALLVFIVLGTETVGILRMRGAIAALEPDIAAKRLQARKVLAVEGQAAELEKLGNLLARRPFVTSQMRVLNELARVLPDDTWVTSLRQSGNQLLVSGYSSNAAQLIGLMGASQIFEHPKFRSPTIASGEDRIEHFDLSVDLKTPGRP